MPNRKRYVVMNRVNGKVVIEGFSKPAMDAMKKLEMVVFKGSRRTTEGTIYEYMPKGRYYS